MNAISLIDSFIEAVAYLEDADANEAQVLKFTQP